ncbi:hypothetical protein F66182_1201 [Fusarium sp. NRRL 66182]|nr:hypothetical protein F66182_1201 [Fusarium sp. NRRL 66182]
MPRRRPPNKTGPVQRRTRSGCQTCRSRKVKCDEAKPACRNCASRGLPCNTQVQLKWEAEFVARGLSFGREGVWSRDTPDARQQRQPQTRWPIPFVTPNIEPRHFINTYYSDFDFDSTYEKSLEEETIQPREQLEASALVLQSRSPSSLISSLSPFPTLDTSNLRLLEYYLLRLCPLTTPSSQLSSPFASLIAPLFTHAGQDLLVQSVLAFSARHRSITDPRWSRSAMRIKGNVLAALLQRFQSPEVSTDVILDPQVPAAMMFLCLYEILDNGDHRWVIHLRASQDFMRKRQQILPTASRDSGFASLAAFAERYFAFQDVISRTACGNSPIFGLEYWQRPGQPEELDAWMGCSPAMASVIFRITELARTRTRENMSKAVFDRQVDELDRDLTVVSSSITITEALDDSVKRSVGLKKIAVQLYFHCLLRDADPATSIVSQMVIKILQSIQELLQLGCFAGLLFPLFVAAVELNPLDDESIFHHGAPGTYISGRRLVLETLGAMVGSSLANTERTKAVILKVWRMRDLNTQSSHPDPKTDSNDWNTFVSPYTQDLSLA